MNEDPRNAVSIHLWASLVPAAAVIPAQVAYFDVAAVKKLGVCWHPRPCPCGSPCGIRLLGWKPVQTCGATLAFGASLFLLCHALQGTVFPPLGNERGNLRDAAMSAGARTTEGRCRGWGISAGAILHPREEPTRGPRNPRHAHGSQGPLRFHPAESFSVRIGLHPESHTEGPKGSPLPLSLGREGDPGALVPQRDALWACTMKKAERSKQLPFLAIGCPSVA